LLLGINTDDCIKLVYSFADFGSLKDVIYSEKYKLSFHRKLSIMRDVASAIDWLHIHNILHLNLKPSNVLIDYSWKPKLTDIGLSTLTTIDGSTHELNFISGRGTPGYMAPEMYENVPQPTTKSDVYTYGVLFWEIIAEQPPFNEDSNKDEVFEVIKQKINNNEDLGPTFHYAFPEPIKELISPCLEFNPNLRPSISIFKEEELSHNYEVKVYEESETKGLKLWEQFKDANEVSWDVFFTSIYAIHWTAR